MEDGWRGSCTPARFWKHFPLANVAPEVVTESLQRRSGGKKKRSCIFPLSCSTFLCIFRQMERDKQGWVLNPSTSLMQLRREREEGVFNGSVTSLLACSACGVKGSDTIPSPWRMSQALLFSRGNTSQSPVRRTEHPPCSVFECPLKLQTSCSPPVMSW